MLKKAMKMKKLRLENQHNFFKQTFYHGEICRYVFAHFLYEDVKRLADKAGIVIRYFPPGTEEYKRFGDNVFEIIHPPEVPGFRKEEFKPVLFDPATLMI